MYEIVYVLCTVIILGMSIKLLLCDHYFNHIGLTDIFDSKTMLQPVQVGCVVIASFKRNTKGHKKFWQITFFSRKRLGQAI